MESNTTKKTPRNNFGSRKAEGRSKRDEARKEEKGCAFEMTERRNEGRKGKKKKH